MDVLMVAQYKGERVLNGCRKYEEFLARYLDGDALLQDREELEKHLAVCPDCERLYVGISDVDQALRELPGKQVDPPPYLHARIVANLPEVQAVPHWAVWGRWAAGFGVAIAGIIALSIAVHRGESPRTDRIASAPSPAPVVQPAEPARPKETPLLQAVPEPGGKRDTEVASSPKVQVIREVKIFFYYPPAQKVAVTGDFNNWDADGVPLKAAGKPGLWETDLRLPPGAYSYNFIVDGELLVPDPNSSNQMPDGYGGTNSILLVQGDTAI
jgi:hypothetical protein